MTRRVDKAQAGFSLIEALIAMTMMGAIIGVIATITAQWLPNWNRGFVIVQSKQLLERGLERVIADISAAEYVPLGGEKPDPLFVGSERSVIFVRPALGPNTLPGLEIVRIAETADQHGTALVRTRTRFMPAEHNADLKRLPAFRDPVVLLRAPYRVTFSYAGNDRVWTDTWENGPRLPRAVRILVHDGVSRRLLPESTVATIHVDTPPPCTEQNSVCGDNNDNKPAQSQVNDDEQTSTDATANAEAQR